MDRLLPGESGDGVESSPREGHLQVAAKRRAERVRQGLPVRGPRSLVAMATAVLAKNAHQLSAEHVEELSDERRASLRKAIVGSRDLSATLWKILLPRKRSPRASASALTLRSANASSSAHAALLKPDAERTHMFCSQVRTPTNQLGPYIQSLTTPAMEFVAHIRIMACGHADFGYHELVKLASMPNLGILEIIEINLSEHASNTTVDAPLHEHQSRLGHTEHPSAQAGDRLMRGWCAAKPVPFPELRVLRLWGCSCYALSPRSLEYAAAFPKLAYYAMSVHGIQDNSGARGARGIWAQAQVKEYTRTYGWHGFKYDTGYFEYANDSDRRLDRVAAHPVRPELTLNMVERDSTPHQATDWGGRFYSFAADRGFMNEDRADGIEAKIELLGGLDAHPITHNIASLSLGVDRVVKSSWAGTDNIRTDTACAFVFVRTNEQLQAQAEANQKHREALAEQRAQRAADRRAQVQEAHGDAVLAVREAGLPEPAAPPARKRTATTADPDAPRKLRQSVSAREMEMILAERKMRERP